MRQRRKTEEFKIQAARRISRLEAAAHRLGRLARTPLSDLLAQVRRGEHVFLVLLAMAVGLAAAYGAIGFRYLIAGSHYLFFGSFSYDLGQLMAIPWSRPIPRTRS